MYVCVCVCVCVGNKYKFAAEFDYIVMFPSVDVKRKVLPAWLRDSLEKLDRDRQKKMEKESKEGTKGDLSRPAWWNEVEEKGAEPAEAANTPTGHSSRIYRNSKSRSPDQVSLHQKLLRY